MTLENYILLGPPGSGKSTVAKILCNELGIRHIEMENELRKVAKEDNDLGRMVHEIVFEKKELVPDGIVKDVISHILDTYDGGVLLDGAPRVFSQIDEVLDSLEQHGHPLQKVIYLSLPLDIAISRISRRMLCFSCATPYMLGKDKEAEEKKCSACGGEVGHRKDDTEEGVKKRYQIFEEKTMPVIEHFRTKGQVVEINGDGTPEAIEKQVVAGIRN
jgi:adenylate kinase